MDGLWAIRDIIPRTNHKPTVLRLVVPENNFDAQHKREELRRQRKKMEKMMMTMDLNAHLPSYFSSNHALVAHRRHSHHFP